MSQAEEQTSVEAIFEFVENEPIQATFSISPNVQDLNYTHYQDNPSDTWVVQHNLNKFPSVSVVDSAGSVVYADINHINQNKLTLSFSSAFAGRAYLN